jgi:hypothetical protein
MFVKKLLLFFPSSKWWLREVIGHTLKFKGWLRDLGHTLGFDVGSLQMIAVVLLARKTWGSLSNIYSRTTRLLGWSGPATANRCALAEQGGHRHSGCL